MQFLPGPCSDLRTAANIQIFQQWRLAQRFKQICGSICTFRVSVEAPAVFCQKQSERMLGRRQVQVHSILNCSRSTPNPRTTSQISTCYWIRTVSNRDVHVENKKPSTISLYEAPTEICLLQIEPLGTMQFLPGPCWDLRTVGQTQLFQQWQLTQRLKQICGSICSLRVSVEAPAVFCQNQSVENTFGRGQSEGIQSILNPSRSIPTHTITSQNSPCSWIPTTSNRDKHTPTKTRKPSPISLYEALAEICLLQIEPLCTTNFLPGPCWDLQTVIKLQLFQQGRLTQSLQKI